MANKQRWLLKTLLGVMLAWPLVLSAGPVSEVPSGTRFMVELRDKLDAKKIKEGKKFKAETLEAIRASDGGIIPAGAKVKGHVSFVEYNKMVLRFERIESKVGKMPIVARATGIVGERGIQKDVGNEGEIKASKRRGRATGAVIGAGVGAGVGAGTGGKEGAAIGVGVGAAAGGVLGAIIGTTDLVLQKGTRIEVELERPLTFEPKR